MLTHRGQASGIYASTSLQKMAWRYVGANPFPEPIVTSCFRTWGTIFSDFLFQNSNIFILEIAFQNPSCVFPPKICHRWFNLAIATTTTEKGCTETWRSSPAALTTLKVVKMTTFWSKICRFDYHQGRQCSWWRPSCLGNTNIRRDLLTAGIHLWQISINAHCSKRWCDLRFLHTAVVFLPMVGTSLYEMGTHHVVYLVHNLLFQALKWVPESVSFWLIPSQKDPLVNVWKGTALFLPCPFQSKKPFRFHQAKYKKIPVDRPLPHSFWCRIFLLIFFPLFFSKRHFLHISH